MKTRNLVAAASLFAAIGAVAETRIAPKTVSHVPFALDRGMPTVEVRVDGKGPYRFAIDTDIATAMLVDPSVATLLSLRHRGTLGTGSKSREVVRVDSLALGKVNFNGIDAVVDNVRSYHVDGVIGYATFRDVLVTVDYPNSEIRLTRGELPHPDGKSVFALKVFNGVPVAVLNDGSGYRFVTVDTRGSFSQSAITFDAAHSRLGIN